jgi:DNA-binding transcriptional ArsR family regulator
MVVGAYRRFIAKVQVGADASGFLAECGELLGPPTGRQFALAAEVLAHLADPTRLHLLQLLAVEQGVSALTAQVAASRSSVSQHLGRLRLAGLVQARRDGRRMLYQIASDHLTDLVSEALHYADHAAHGIPHHLARGQLTGDPRRPTRGMTFLVHPVGLRDAIDHAHLDDAFKRGGRVVSVP